MSFLSNSINLSPYTLSHTSKSILSSQPHWFLLHLIVGIANFSQIIDSSKVNITADDILMNGWFCKYLYPEQLKYLNNLNIFELLPIEKKQKVSPLSNNGNSYHVIASPDWLPPDGAKITSRVSPTFYIVQNLTITNDVRQDQRILSISPVSNKRLLNRYSAGFLQNGNQQSFYSSDGFETVRTLHNIGLDGTGQVINIVDTGIDVFSPFFYDENNSLDSISSKTNLKHRKVIRIESYADDRDYTRGHGTHVSGIAAGKAFCKESKCGISQYDGIAPGAKIYMSDIGHANIDGDLSENFDLDEQAKLLIENNAYISSNSWSYDFQSNEDIYLYDKAAYTYQDILYLFAVGNDYSYFSINTPSTCKNVIAVGATYGPTSSQGENNRKRITISNNSVTVYGEEKREIIWNHGVDNPMDYIINASIANTSSYASYLNPVVIVSNASCKDYQYLEPTAKAALYFSKSSLSCTKNDIPLIRLSPSDESTVLQMGNISLLPYNGYETSLPEISSLSSCGPSFTSISKPDISLPGYQIISAKSHGRYSGLPISTSHTDSVFSSSGTSMATPAASGLAIIIRQFFVDGWYPTRIKNPSDSITPSSYLIKAMMINSATQKNRYESGPNFEFGFGIPCLEKVFGMQSLSNKENVNSGLRIIDREMISSASHKVYNIYINNKSNDLIITMVYLDPPLNPDNAALFFGDLDLVIKSPNGKYYFGNNLTVAESDSFSNSERVIIPKEDIIIGTYEIHIISTEFPLDQNVNYAIVVNGPFDQNNLDANPKFLTGNNSNTCINNCNGHGTCENGRCKCNDGYAGLTCNTVVHVLHENNSDTDTYYHKMIKFFKIVPNNAELPKASVSFNFKTGNGKTFFCFSNKNSEKIANADWSCFEAASSGNFLINVSESNSIYMAVYMSYHKPISITISDILFSNSSAQPTEIPTHPPTHVPTPVIPKQEKKEMGLYILLGVGLVVIVFIATVVIYFLWKRKRNPIMENTESIDPTLMITDADADVI